MIISFTCMADKKRDILEFVQQSNFEHFTPTQKLNLMFIQSLLAKNSIHFRILHRRSTKRLNGSFSFWSDTKERMVQVENNSLLNWTTYKIKLDHITIVKMKGTRYLSKNCIWLRFELHKASFISDGIV